MIYKINSFPGRDVDFFLRIHRHLPDEKCGGFPFGACNYRPDLEPLNAHNDYLSILQKNPIFLQKEKEVEEAVIKGIIYQ